MFKQIFIPLSDLMRFFIIYLPGHSGRKLRYFYYRKKFKKCGKNVKIDEGVIIEEAKWITIGDNVWIDKYCILTAGRLDLTGHPLKKKENKNFKWKEGELIIGSGVHIGSYSVVQAHGGIHIGDNVTFSAGCKAYSLSNYPFDEKHPRSITHANYLTKSAEKIPYIISPLVIENNVWLALDCLVLGGTIGENSFVVSKSLILHDLPRNSYASGFPAKKIKNRFNLSSKIYGNKK